MPDITMCTNSECPLSKECYRFRCEPKEHGQSYSSFHYSEDPETKIVSCNMFIDNSKTNSWYSHQLALAHSSRIKFSIKMQEQHEIDMNKLDEILRKHLTPKP